MSGVKLVRPTDFEILKSLADTGGRNVAANVAQQLGKDRSYINARFSQLAENDLIEKVGPANKSGLYDITRRGQVALEHRDKYQNPEQFADLLDQS